MLSTLAGRKQFLYDSLTNTIHDLSNEVEDCQINSLDKTACSVCDTEQQVKEIALFEDGHQEVRKCPHCFHK